MKAHAEKIVHYLFKVVFFCVIIGGMGKKGNVKRILPAILLCMAILLSACGDKQIVLTTGFGEDEVFRVDGRRCVKAEVMVYLYNLHEQYESAYGSGIWTAGGEGVDLKQNLKQTVLARIAKVKLMNILAERYQVSLSSADVTKAQQAAQMYFSSLSAAELELMGGLTQELTQKMYEEYAVAGMLYDKLTEGVDTEISDDEARVVRLHRIALMRQQTADDGSAVYMDIDELKVKADEIMEKLEAGDDFDTLAYAYNEGGQISVDMVKGVEAPEVESVCFGLAEGEISTPLAMSDGVYIYKCISTYDRQQTEERKRTLANERKKAAFDAMYNEFAAGMEIYLNEDLWNAIELTDISDHGGTDFFEIYERFFVSTQ